MTQVEDVQLFLAKKDKPYHLTGEVGAKAYLERLTPADRLHLGIILHHAQSVATAIETILHVLAVGSSTNLQAPYGDIDLLFCPEVAPTRIEFVRQLHTQLSLDGHFTVSKEYPKGSAPVFNSPYTPFKLFAFPHITGDVSGYCGSFDMTFLGERGGSFEEALVFHQRNKLAFSKLESSFTSNLYFP